MRSPTVWRGKVSSLISVLFLSFSSCKSFNMAMETNNIRNNQQKYAVVVGSTGATGRYVVKKLLERNWIVQTVSRREFDYEVTDEMKGKLTQIISDFSDQDNLIEKWSGSDALFNCLGTTRGQAGGAEQFVQVEVGLTKVVNEIAKQANIVHVGVVSAQGANKDMWVPSTYIHPMLYIRTLGEKQQSVIDTKFPSTSIFQPGMLNRLVGDRGMENFFVNLLPTLRVDILAEAMILDAETKLETLSTECKESKSDIVPQVTFYEGNNVISNIVDNHRNH